MQSEPESHIDGEEPQAEGWVQRMGERYADWPLVRLLLFSIWFRVVVLGMLGMGLAGGVLLPRVWRVTPPEIKSGVRISLLDRIQSWDGKRRARGLEAAGEYGKASARWGSAYANNPGDLDAARGFLWNVGSVAAPEAQTPAVVKMGYWLLRLGHTNEADLEIVAGAWLQCGLGPPTARLLDPYRERLTSEVRRVYAMALLQADRVGEFARVLGAQIHGREGSGGGGVAPGLAAMRKRLLEGFGLHEIAWSAGWGPEPGRAEAMSRLRAAQADPRTERMAYDLELVVHRQRRDVAGCAEMLQRLEEAGRLGVRHRLGYWQLLLAEGRKEEVRQLLAAGEVRPGNVLEAFGLSRIHLQVGAFEQAAELLGRYGPNMVWFADRVVLQSEILMGMRRWEALLDLAIEIRMQPEAGQAMSGYSYYLSAVAETRMNRHEFAQRSLEVLEKGGIPEPQLAVRVAGGLLDIGQVSAAQRLLLSHREVVMAHAGAVRLLVRCADYLKQEDHLLEAAEAQRRFLPEDPAAASDLAVALLICRVRQDEALRLSLEAALAFPGRVRTVLSRADALLWTGRLKEADELLHRVPLTGLDSDMVQQYRLVEAELLAAQGRVDEALAVGRAIDLRGLFVSQHRRLKALLDRIEAGRTGPKA
jgi:tetratricopeptide (TPR) repeat protein